jgi:hypothetical protein
MMTDRRKPKMFRENLAPATSSPPPYYMQCQILRVVMRTYGLKKHNATG